MAISLLVLLVPVFLIVVIYRELHGGDQPVVIDPAPVVAEARAAGLPVTDPTGLPGGWRTVSATFQPGTDGAVLRLGYLTPHGDGAQVIQSAAPAEKLLPAELTGSARPEGTVQLNATGWQRYRARPGERALVLLQPDRTIIVIGTAAEAELRSMAQSLSH